MQRKQGLLGRLRFTRFKTGQQVRLESLIQFLGALNQLRGRELALLGLEAAVELTNGDNGRWYRVTMGPFASRSEIARARSKAAQANMDTLLLKRESP